MNYVPDSRFILTKAVMLLEWPSRSFVQPLLRRSLHVLVQRQLSDGAFVRARLV